MAEVATKSTVPTPASSSGGKPSAPLIPDDIIYKTKDGISISWHHSFAALPKSSKDFIVSTVVCGRNDRLMSDEC
jgi:hypothetical protein